MVLQFLCPSCGHPIEIDDEWASQSVACPYCKNTVTAPGESTYQPPSSIPAARALDQHAADVPEAPPVDRTRGNLVAMLALGLSGLSLVSFLAFRMVAGPDVAEIIGPDGTPQEFQEYLNEQIQQGAMPPWFRRAMLMFFAGTACWVGGLICAIVGVQRRFRRGLAFAAFGLLTLVPFFFCSGFILGP